MQDMDGEQPQSAMPDSTGGQFKPNIYPIILWALVYGLAAGVLLFLITIAQQFVTALWVPLFLAGVVWGGWRNYVRQKSAWLSSQGQAYQPASATTEFREALSDIRTASQDLWQQDTEPAAPTESSSDSEEPPQPSLPASGPPAAPSA